MAATNAVFTQEVCGKRNYAAIDEVYTADARILPPGAPMVSGRDAIRNFWVGVIESMNVTAATLESVDVMPSGDGVVEIGSATITMQPEGQDMAQLVVKYVVFWRQEEGKWKWHVDIWNTNA